MKIKSRSSSVQTRVRVIDSRAVLRTQVPSSSHYWCLQGLFSGPAKERWSCSCAGREITYSELCKGTLVNPSSFLPSPPACWKWKEALCGHREQKTSSKGNQCAAMKVGDHYRGSKAWKRKGSREPPGRGVFPSVPATETVRWGSCRPSSHDG